jgi:hypothetical protein
MTPDIPGMQEFEHDWLETQAHETILMAQSVAARMQAEQVCPLPHRERNRLPGVSQCVLLVTQADPAASGSRWSAATVVVFL